MQRMKRLLAGFLTLVLLLTSVPVQAFAVQDTGSTEASMDSQNVDFEGTNAVGTLLAEAIAQEQQSTIVSSEDTPYEDGYTLTDIVVQGSVATVTYDAMEEAQLVVALYSDDGMQLLNTAKITVTPEETTATVTFSGQMPQYFVAAAYLLDVYDFSPLCPSYETPMYTQDMQELLDMTVADCVEEYGEERIYNLDDSNQTNFAVYADGAVLLYEEDGVNTVTSADDVNLVYVIANADDHVTSLTEGSIVVYEYADGELLLMKVGTIAVDGTTVTIQGADMELEEVFALMKVEGEADTEDVTFDPTGLDENMEYLGTSGPQTYAFDTDATNKTAFAFSFRGEKDDDISEKDAWDKKVEKDFIGKGKFYGTFTLEVEANVKIYLSTKRQFLEIKITPSITLAAELSGYINFQSKQLGEGFTIPLGSSGVKAKLRPTVNLKFSGEIELEAKLYFVLGLAAEHRSGGNWQCRNLSAKPKLEPKLEFEGKVFFGFDLHPLVYLQSEKLLRADITGMVGFELTGKREYKTEDYTAPRIHDCNICVDGDLSAVLELKLEMTVLNNKKLKLKHTFLDGSLKILEFYWSIDEMKIGKGECPNYRYRVYITVKDENMNTIEGVEVGYIEKDSVKKLGVSNANGVVMDESIFGNPRNLFLPRGSYIFQADNNGEIIRSPEPVEVYTYTSTMLTSNKDYWKRQAKLKLLMIQPDSIKTGSILDSGVCGNNLEWQFYSSGLLEITGKGAMDKFSSAAKAPWYKYRDKIKSLRIGEPPVDPEKQEASDLITVSNYAFSGYTKLEKVILEDNVKQLGLSTFANCTKLDEIKMPVDLDIYYNSYSSSNHSFTGCTNVTKIHYTYGQTGKMTQRMNSAGSSFSYSYIYSLENTARESLQYAYIEEGITNIAAHAFYHAENLQDIYIPVTIGTIGSSAFAGCTSLTQVDIPEGLTTFGTEVFSGCTGLTSIYIPTTLTTIPGGCFYGCTGLTELVIPDNVTALYEDSFSGCSNLTKVTMPIDLDIYCYENNASIKHYSFAGCTNVKEICYTYGQTGKMTERDTTCAYSFASYGYQYSLEYLSRGALERVTFDPRITDIAGYAFYEATNLVSAELPSAVTAIGGYAFYNCKKLQTIEIPAALTYWGDNAFYNCTAIQEITIPGGVSQIPTGCFFGCSGLTELVIPDNVTALYENSFSGCSNLTKVTMPIDLDIYCYENNASIKHYSFAGCTNVREICYTYGQTGKMTERDTTSTYHFTTYDYECSLEYLSRGALERVTFDPRITDIAGYAFYEAANLVSAELPSALQSVGAYAFFGAKKLVSAPWSPSVTSIGSNAFSGCSSLAKANLYEGMTALGDNAFSGCSSVTTIYIPTTLTAIPKGCFYGCTGLTELVIPDNVTALYEDSFSGCSNLTKVTMPIDLDIYCYENNASIKHYSFAGCTNVREICYTYGQTGKMTERDTTCAYSSASYGYQYSLEYFSRGALERITFAPGILDISGSAFNGCSALSNILFLGNAPTISSDSFSGVTADALYPDGNDTWTEDTMQSYGGTLTWTPYILDEDGSIRTEFDSNTMELEPEETEPEETEPVETEPAETEPVETEPEETEPVETDPVVTEPEETEPEQTDPVVTEPAETEPVKTEPQETVPETTSEQIPSSASAAPEEDIANPGTVGSGSIHVNTPAANAVYGGMNEAEFEEASNITIQTTTFNGLVAGSEYVMFALASMDAADLLAPSNILYIGQAPADANGSLSFRYIQKTPTDKFNVFACGASHRHLKNASITFPQMSYNGELRIAEPTVTYGGKTLVEGVDYIVLDGQGAENAGDYLCTIRGICNYTGLITCKYTVNAGINTVAVAAADLDGQNSVWIDGAEYPVATDGDMCYVNLPDSDARAMTLYTYHSGSDVSDPKQYPTGMKVWTLDNENGIYTLTRQEAFDDILQYSGMSIRVTGKKGIRMITAIEQEKKNTLTSDGLAGYTLKEYGTAVAWASRLESGNPLVLGQPYVQSSYAYRRGIADPVFAYSGSQMQYTNVLVNFSDEQCKNELALRPYMILEDAEGEEITLYGGIVCRSIGYIAYQNRNEFVSQTEAYHYIWDIIHYVYGDVYDDELIPV